MDIKGLALCCRYSYPPNSLSLCGPDKKGKQTDLNYYSTLQIADRGTLEILSQFSTLMPYLSTIAHDNNISDPFDIQVVEAYWLGNNLLQKVQLKSLAHTFDEELNLKKKLNRLAMDKIFTKLAKGALPHHSFHVLNIYKRTGLLDIPHTIQTMDACIINWGKISKIDKFKIIVDTKPLSINGDKISFGQTRSRTLMFQGDKDILSKDLKKGDWISYHWGIFCERLNRTKLNNLIYYTKLSIDFANILT